MCRLTLLACAIASTDAWLMNGPARPVSQQIVRRASSPTCKLSKEEKRKLKLETGANWPPRTKPESGVGYIFFNGPTPKTSVQPDVPSFFSKANFEDLELSPAQTLVTATGLGSFLAIASVLFGGQTEPIPAPKAAPAVVAPAAKPAPAPKAAPKAKEA